MKTSLSLVALVSLVAISVLQSNTRAADYKLLKEIPVGGAGGFDYLNADPEGHRLYVTHGTSVVVIDTEKDSVVGSITNTPGVHGFAIAADLGKGFSSNGRENKVAIVDLKTLALISKADTGANPDAILYESGQQEVYAFNHSGSSATVIDAKTGKVVATVPLSGLPESGAADPKAERVFVNIEDKNEIAVIDTKTHKVVATWPIAPGEGATGMAFDVEHHRLFIVTGNRTMEMIDSTTGKVVGSVPIGGGADASAFDPGTQLAFASTGQGGVTIAHEDSPEKLTVVQTLTTANGARTMTIDPKTHKIYLAAGQGAMFRVLVFGM